jgi:hypothetical protein
MKMAARGRHFKRAEGKEPKPGSFTKPETEAKN